ncbi:MAG: tRNA (adenosine(37)-N6)-threonylcarbamoyltransferase complex ATPase subunit type 1 TsaE [Kiritimatiellia bacterium]|nr:tRNA (adenosine(37)-N6)-threonylcarbamoyltransferase complex ATPase subunit type 1 TsaE [Lentisphaerota bacterium]
MEFTTNSSAETKRRAAALAPRLPAGTVIALYGEIGAGKTCFVQGLARGLGIKGPVASPTFIIINEHAGKTPLYHVDLYRLPTVEDALQIGLEEYFSRDGITVIEWAERAEELLPPGTIRVHLTAQGQNCRHIAIQGLADD